MGPQGMSKDLVHKINTDVISIIKRHDFQERLIADAIEPVGNTPEEFAAQVVSDLASWNKLIKTVNIKVD
jgi:tripartite-type tricarboxylate transporter receptor subunit TctC